MKSTIDNTYGALFLSIVISSVLYGVGILQFWMYIRKYHAKDSLILTSLVSTVLICDTFQLAFLCHGDPKIYFSVVNSLMIEVFFSCAIATLVQQFYCWRIYKIGNRLFVAVVMLGVICGVNGYDYMYSATWIFTQPIAHSLWNQGVNALPSLLLFVLTTLLSVQLKYLFQVIELKPLGITSMTLTAVTDVAISVSMVILLQASKTGYKRTTDLINRLMIFTFNTGLPPAISAILCNVTIVLWPNTFVFIFFFLILGRLYTNSLLVTLNSRDYIKAASDDIEQYSLESSTFAARRGSRPLSKVTMPQDSASDHIGIPIDKEQTKDFN
ncbi:hypothetical protein MVEN_01852800 [Mycena venus]|uniref:DUF6534 domain-containing protein n=1 Tax=Mycena venus TaxID=2733690 RepID=A0A8H6XIR7_9AGAR|nr:hypothetical protein MVEN_01852800 [Mycena venus]